MNEFVAFLHEVFERFGEIDTRKMFGGYGVYHQGIMFALVSEDELYFKADELNRPDFVHRGLAPFEYNKAGKTIKMSYFLAPESIFDERGEASDWALAAYGAALRSRKNQGE